MRRNTSCRVATARVAMSCALIAGASVPCPKAIAGPNNPVIEIDHTSGDVTYKYGEISIKLDTLTPQTVPLRSGQVLEIRVKTTNPLLYTYGQEVKEEEFVDKTALFKYLGGIQGGISGVLALIPPPKKLEAQIAPAIPDRAAESLAGRLEKLRIAVAAVEEDARRTILVESLYFEALQASEMGCRAERDPSAKACPAEVREVLQTTGIWPEETTGIRAQEPSERAEALREVAWKHALRLEGERREAVAARTAFADSDFAKTEAGKKILAETDKVLASVPTKALDLARDVEKMIVRFRGIEAWLKTGDDRASVAEPKELQFQWDKSRTITVSVEKKKDLVDKIAYRPRKFEKVTFKVVPDWWLQPSIGAGLIWADKLRWKEWGVLDSGGQKVASSTGETNKRFQFFPTISLTARPLSGLAARGISPFSNPQA